MENIEEWSDTATAIEITGIALADVREIVHWREGENDGDAWMGVLILNDGQWAYIESWCDYTGWGCQDGGEAFYAPSEETLVSNCLTQEARHIFGYEVPPDCGV